MTDMPPEVRDRLEHAASLYEQAAAELERGAAHARRAAEHFRDGAVPRDTAQAWATRGHVVAASRHLDEQAALHRERANP